MKAVAPVAEAPVAEAKAKFTKALEEARAGAQALGKQATQQAGRH